MRSMKETESLAQSIIDTYLDNPPFTEIEDGEGYDLLLEVASIHGQILDNVVRTKWFRDELTEYLASNEGVKG